MNEKEIFALLNDVGAVTTNTHAVYTSGKHGSMYVNKDALYPHTKETSALCHLIAEHFAKSNIDVVVGPALGGIIPSQWIAYHLSELQGREVLGVYAEKVEDAFVIKRGYDKLIPGKNILVFEDNLTTGRSIKKVIEVIRKLEGNVIGLGAFCNRGNIQSADVGGVPDFFSLINIPMEAWEPDECPLCAQGVPINTSVGKGREFSEKKK
ncbi:MAG: phosphoribosyltransferase family protein [Verrucomicrobiae bacterium]|nr:phosphoribosyltransferase family protein [Verrucomicrobiae bacterium]